MYFVNTYRMNATLLGPCFQTFFSAQVLRGALESIKYWIQSHILRIKNVVFICDDWIQRCHSDFSKTIEIL